MNKPQVSKKHPILRPPYFDRKLISTGTTRVIAVNGIIPDNWENVRIVPLQVLSHCITVKLYKLAKVVKTAQPPQNNQRSKQDP